MHATTDERARETFEQHVVPSASRPENRLVENWLSRMRPCDPKETARVATRYCSWPGNRTRMRAQCSFLRFPQCGYDPRKHAGRREKPPRTNRQLFVVRSHAGTIRVAANAGRVLQLGLHGINGPPARASNVACTKRFAPCILRHSAFGKIDNFKANPAKYRRSLSVQATARCIANGGNVVWPGTFVRAAFHRRR